MNDASTQAIRERSPFVFGSILMGESKQWPGAYVERHGGMYLCCLTQEQRARTCSYWYTVTVGATAHTAFRTRAALLAWIAGRGLSLSAPIPDEYGTHQCQGLVGEYRSASHCNRGTFDALPWFKESRGLSNGKWTEMRFTREPDGIVTVHKMNPNYERRTFDYAECQSLEDSGLLGS